MIRGIKNFKRVASSNASSSCVIKVRLWPFASPIGSWLLFSRKLSSSQYFKLHWASLSPYQQPSDFSQHQNSKKRWRCDRSDHLGARTRSQAESHLLCFHPLTCSKHYRCFVQMLVWCPFQNTPSTNSSNFNIKQRHWVSKKLAERDEIQNDKHQFDDECTTELNKNEFTF